MNAEHLAEYKSTCFSIWEKYKIHTAKRYQLS